MSQAAVPPTDLEEVPLTEEERTAIAEAWLGQIHAVAAGSEPDVQNLLGKGVFVAIVNQILLAHDFEANTGAFTWRADAQLVLMARRQPTVRASEMSVDQ